MSELENLQVCITFIPIIMAFSFFHGANIFLIDLSNTSAFLIHRIGKDTLNNAVESRFKLDKQGNERLRFCTRPTMPIPNYQDKRASPNLTTLCIRISYKPIS